MVSTKLNIGKIPISKGEYQDGIAYQRLNQVTMLGSTYQSKIDDNTSAPAHMGADGAVENINTDKWLCIAVGNVSAARKVVYNNETSGLEAGNVQEAIDEVGSKVSDLSEKMIVIKDTFGADPKDGTIEVGEYYYNYSLNILRQCIDDSYNFKSVSLLKGAIYTMKGDFYYWDGNRLRQQSSFGIYNNLLLDAYFQGGSAPSSFIEENATLKVTMPTETILRFYDVRKGQILYNIAVNGESYEILYGRSLVFDCDDNTLKVVNIDASGNYILLLRYLLHGVSGLLSPYYYKKLDENNRVSLDAKIKINANNISINYKEVTKARADYRYQGGKNPTFKINNGNLEITMPSSDYGFLLYDNITNKNIKAAKNNSDVFILSTTDKLIFNFSSSKIEKVETADTATDYILLARWTGSSVNGLFAPAFDYYMHQQLEQRVANNENALSSIPTYWREYFESGKLSEIKENLRKVGSHGDSFCFVTDVHVGFNYMHSPSLVKYILDNSNVNMAVCGGDILQQNDSLEAAQNALDGYVEKFRKTTFMMRGNHDTNLYGTGIVTTENFYADVTKSAEKLTNTNGKTYYCVDNEAQKIRYIFLDTGDEVSEGVNFKGSTDADVTFRTEQLNFMKAKMQELSQGWHIVILSHIYFSGAPKETATLTVAGEGEFIKGAIDEVYDKLKAELVGVIAGHCHRDYSITTEKGYKVISTTCDASYNLASVYDPDAPDRIEGTTTEQALDVFSIDTLNKKIYICRVGAGSSREYDY